MSRRTGDHEHRRPRNPAARALHDPAFRPRVVPNKKKKLATSRKGRRSRCDRRPDVSAA